MEIDFSQKIIDHTGKEMDFTLGQVCIGALNATDPARPLSLEESVRRGTLAIKLGDGGVVDLKASEITLILSNLPRAWSPLVVARAQGILEPKTDAD